MAQVSELLIDDHTAVDKVLKQVQTALHRGDLEVAHKEIDLFWARLAVHIRAEHLHLFPTVLAGLENDALDEAQTVVMQLRQDHDFFMHELALAVEIMRELLTFPQQVIVEERLNNVIRIVLEVERRLVKHNELEEDHMYRWAAIVLNSHEQANLAKLVTAELEKRPSRFNLSTWLNKR